MGKIFSALLLALFGTQAAAVKCLHKGDEQYYPVIGDRAAAQLFVQENHDNIGAFDLKYGPGSAQALLDNRYVDYLIEVGCGMHVKDNTVEPVVNVVKLFRQTMSKERLLQICSVNFPKTWEEDGGQLYIRTTSGILRYRGRECSLVKFE